MGYIRISLKFRYWTPLKKEELASIKSEMESMLDECQETHRQQAQAVRIYQQEMAVLLQQVNSFNKNA